MPVLFIVFQITIFLFSMMFTFAKSVFNSFSKVINRFPIIFYPVIFLSAFYWILYAFVKSKSGTIPEICRFFGRIFYENPVSKHIGSKVDFERIIDNKLNYIRHTFFATEIKMIIFAFVFCICMIVFVAICLVLFALPYYCIWLIPFFIIQIILIVRNIIFQKRKKYYDAMCSINNKEILEI